MSLSEVVARHARTQPDRLAFVAPDDRITWAEYDVWADALAGELGRRGLTAGDRVAVLVPDGPAVHVAFLAVERAGFVIVGIGPRAGAREVEHLLGLTGARLVVTDSDRLAEGTHLDLPRLDPGGFRPEPGTVRAPIGDPAGGMRPVDDDDLWLCNSTSGTTGLPKCVMHDQQRWFAFHRLAVAAGDLGPDDVFLSALPAPFGFGIWTAHVTPTLLGAPTVRMQQFDPVGVLRMIERERVSVLAAVSTQFIMLLNEPTLPEFDLSSLRVLFTGGEMVPYERAREFEERTGCTVLQFYGSNETGALSRTTLADSADVRLRTAGRVIPEMHVRLLADDGSDVTATGGPGIAACRGPLTCQGYFGDPEADARLRTADGWMLTGDYCTIDADGILSVTGRASDFIIRGGKNISAAQVEDEVATHPAVALAAAVAMPDPVFGERVCIFVALRPGADAPDLDGVRDHLRSRGVGKELWPERVVVCDALPLASGGKVAKGALRDDIRARLAAEAGAVAHPEVGA
ncbi:MAG: class I adenylate-forming enzyme family protein [Actinomycetes bacterium]